MDFKANWQFYMKVVAVIVAVVLWAVTTQATLDRHIADQKDTVKLLMLICKHTSPSPIDKLECYDTLSGGR